MELITTAAPADYTPPSASIVHHTTASLVEGERPGVVHITQYDQTLPIIAVRLMGSNMPYTVPAGAAINFRARKPDGKYIYNPALGISADGSTAYIAVTPQTAAAAGKMRAVIEIVLDGAIAATANFCIEIAANPVPQDAIDSQDEYLTIQDLLQAAREAASAAKASETAAADSAADAAKSESNAQQSSKDAENSASTADDHAAAAKQSAQDAAASEAAAKSSETAASGSAEAAASSASAAADSEEAARKYAEMAQQIGQGAKGWYETEDALQTAHPTGEDGWWAIVGATDTIWVWDGDTETWKDSGVQTDLSNYYTIPQTDNLLSGKATKEQVQTAQTAAENAAAAASNAQNTANAAQTTANAAMPIAGGTFRGNITAAATYTGNWHVRNSFIRTAAGAAVAQPCYGIYFDRK